MRFFWFALIAVSSISLNANAQLVEKMDADALESAMTAAGLSPEIKLSADGSPVATGQAGDFSFYVRGLSCEGSPAACEDIMFFANFDLGRAATEKDYRIVSSYNDSQVFGRAYVLKSGTQVGVDYVIELGGGVSETHVAENIGRWADVIIAFVEKFQEGMASS